MKGSAKCLDNRVTNRVTAIGKTLHRNLFLLLFIAIFSWGGCHDGTEEVPKTNTNLGRAQYVRHCAACHKPDGSGAEGVGPPLADSSWLRGPESRLIRIVLHGVRGPIEVRGVTYNREMIGFRYVLNDDQIASVLTYIRSRWGDIGKPVREEDVRRIRLDALDRTTFWTVEELLEIP